jgi:hypothetical protein
MFVRPGKIVVQKRVVKTAVVTGKPITITARRRVVFSIKTKTITKISTQVPGKVTSTATISSTDTLTATETQTASVDVTSTTTVTSTSVTTAFFACATSNLLSQINGVAINNVYNNAGGGSTFNNMQAASAEACCELCQQTANCSAFNGGR